MRNYVYTDIAGIRKAVLIIGRESGETQLSLTLAASDLKVVPSFSFPNPIARFYRGSVLPSCYYTFPTSGTLCPLCLLSCKKMLYMSNTVNIVVSW